MIETEVSASLYCDRFRCKTDTVYNLAFDGEGGWVLPEGWLELSGNAAKIEWDRAKERFAHAAPPHHLCPDCAKDHTPDYRVWKPPFRDPEEGVVEYCVFCGDDRPCRADTPVVGTDGCCARCGTSIPCVDGVYLMKEHLEKGCTE